MALRSWVRVILCVLCVALPVTGKPAPQTSSRHARVELIPHQDSIAACATLELGVHFVLEKGWHIYWINPGDSGQPPALKWQLPEGFTAGEIQWPRPERMQSNPQLADYGYHDEVLLMVPIHAPPLINISGPLAIRLAVEAKWLICREVCLPDHAQLQVALPMAGKMIGENPSSAKLFADTERLLPKPLPRTWKANTISRRDNFVLAVVAGKRITKAEFFPLEPGQVDNAARQKLQPSAAGVRITLKKSDLLMKPIEVLRGVLVLKGGDVFRIEAPVRQSIQ